VLESIIVFSAVPETAKLSKKMFQSGEALPLVALCTTKSMDHKKSADGYT